MTETNIGLPSTESSESLKTHPHMESVKLKFLAHQKLGDGVYESAKTGFKLSKEGAREIVASPTLPHADINAASQAESAEAWGDTAYDKAYQDWSTSISAQANGDKDRQAFLNQFLGKETPQGTSPNITQGEIDKLYQACIGDEKKVMAFEKRIKEMCVDSKTGEISHEQFEKNRDMIAWLSRKLYGVKTVGVVFTEGMDGDISAEDKTTQAQTEKDLQPQEDGTDTKLNTPRSKDEVPVLDEFRRLLGLGRKLQVTVEDVATPPPAEPPEEPVEPTTDSEPTLPVTAPGGDQPIVREAPFQEDERGQNAQEDENATGVIIPEDSKINTPLTTEPPQKVDLPPADKSQASSTDESSEPSRAVREHDDRMRILADGARARNQMRADQIAEPSRAVREHDDRMRILADGARARNQMRNDQGETPQETVPTMDEASIRRNMKREGYTDEAINAFFVSEKERAAKKVATPAVRTPPVPPTSEPPIAQKAPEPQPPPKPPGEAAKKVEPPPNYTDRERRLDALLTAGTPESFHQIIGFLSDVTPGKSSSEEPFRLSQHIREILSDHMTIPQPGLVEGHIHDEVIRQNIVRFLHHMYGEQVEQHQEQRFTQTLESARANLISQVNSFVTPEEADNLLNLQVDTLPGSPALSDQLVRLLVDRRDISKLPDDDGQIASANPYMHYDSTRQYASEASEAIQALYKKAGRDIPSPVILVEESPVQAEAQQALPKQKENPLKRVGHAIAAPFRGNRQVEPPPRQATPPPRETDAEVQERTDLALLAIAQEIDKQMFADPTLYQKDAVSSAFQRTFGQFPYFLNHGIADQVASNIAEELRTAYVAYPDRNFATAHCKAMATVIPFVIRNFKTIPFSGVSEQFNQLSNGRSKLDHDLEQVLLKEHTQIEDRSIDIIIKLLQNHSFTPEEQHVLFSVLNQIVAQKMPPKKT